MSRTIIFVAEFTKSKVKTTPANAPTIDIADMLAPTASLLVSGGSPTQLTNMTGVYIYSYSAADSVLPVGLMRTADSTVDLQDVPCLPLAFDSNGFLKADVEDWKGAPAPAMTGDAYARLGAPAGASIAADVAALPAAVWASATRTLTSLSGLTASIAQAVWEYATRTLTQAASSVYSAVSGSLLTIHRGDTWSATLTGLPSSTGYSKIWFTVKEARGDADTDALIQILLTSPPAGTDGLQRLNGATATAAQGSITVNSATSITLALDEAVTAQLAAARNLVYDVQYLISSAVSTATDGNCKITDDVTRATS